MLMAENHITFVSSDNVTVDGDIYTEKTLWIDSGSILQMTGRAFMNGKLDMNFGAQAVFDPPPDRDPPPEVSGVVTTATEFRELWRRPGL